MVIIFTNEAKGKVLGSGKETTRKERSVGGVSKNGMVWWQFFLEKVKKSAVKGVDTVKELVW